MRAKVNMFKDPKVFAQVRRRAPTVRYGIRAQLSTQRKRFVGARATVETIDDRWRRSVGALCSCRRRRLRWLRLMTRRMLPRSAWKR